MPGTTTGHVSSHRWNLRAIDGAGVALDLLGVRGDPSIGDIMPRNRASEVSRERGIAVARMDADEPETDVTWSGIDSPEVVKFCQFCTGEGATYGVGGTAPMVSVNPAGETPCVIIEAQRSPAAGAARVIRFEMASLTWSVKGAIPDTTIDLKFSCTGRVQ